MHDALVRARLGESEPDDARIGADDREASLVVGAGGWIVIHTTDAGLVGLAFVTAAGLIVYGAILAIAFRAGAWRPLVDRNSGAI